MNANDQFFTLPSNTPSMQDELRRHQGGVAWVETDAADAFQQIPLEETSRPVLAF